MESHVAIEDVAVEPEPQLNRKERRKAANRAKQGTRPRVNHQNRKDIDVVSTAFMRAAKLTAVEKEKFSRPAIDAFDEIRQGKGSVDAWNEIADALNIAMQLTNPGIGLLPDHREKFSDAMNKMAALAARLENGGSWTCYAHELESISLALEFYGIQLDFVSMNEIQKAYDRVGNKIRGAVSGSPGKAAVYVAKGEYHAGE